MMSRQRYMHFDPDLPSPVVLVADPDDGVRSSLRDSLATIGVRVRGYRRGADLLGGVESQAACVITELKLEDMTGIELLARLQERGLDLPVILLASDGDGETAVEAMQAGALDFI
ncbi:MAG: response regulator transcription factor, partial [Steroidobacteraceae bacterium]